MRLRCTSAAEIENHAGRHCGSSSRLLRSPNADDAIAIGPKAVCGGHGSTIHRILDPHGDEAMAHRTERAAIEAAGPQARTRHSATVIRNRLGKHGDLNCLGQANPPEGQIDVERRVDSVLAST